MRLTAPKGYAKISGKFRSSSEVIRNWFKSDSEVIEEVMMSNKFLGQIGIVNSGDSVVRGNQIGTQINGAPGKASGYGVQVGIVNLGPDGDPKEMIRASLTSASNYLQFLARFFPNEPGIAECIELLARLQKQFESP